MVGRPGGDGDLDRRRAQVFVDVLGPTADEIARRVVELVLPEASELSLGRLRARLTRELLAIDADAAHEITLEGPGAGGAAFMRLVNSR